MAHLSREFCLASLADAARALADAERDCASDADAETLLRERVPWLCAQIEADRRSWRFDSWGSSTVVDENVGLPVIPAAAFRALHRVAGLSSAPPIGNAGLLHVYGYLLSAVETPFGLKRDRWTEGGVARALGLPEDAFAPWSDEETTPLERVLGTALPLLEAPDSATGPRSAGSLRLWADDGSRAENASDRADAALARTVVLQHPESGDGVMLYGTKEGTAPIRLLTVFPVGTVTDAWIDELLAIPPRLRFNAALRGREPGSALERREVVVRA